MEDSTATAIPNIARCFSFGEGDDAVRCLLVCGTAGDLVIEGCCGGLYHRAYPPGRGETVLRQAGWRLLYECCLSEEVVRICRTFAAALIAMERHKRELADCLAMPLSGDSGVNCVASKDAICFPGQGMVVRRAPGGSGYLVVVSALDDAAPEPAAEGASVWEVPAETAYALWRTLRAGENQPVVVDLATMLERDRRLVAGGFLPNAVAALEPLFGEEVAASHGRAEAERLARRADPLEGLRVATNKSLEEMRDQGTISHGAFVNAYLEVNFLKPDANGNWPSPEEALRFALEASHRRLEPEQREAMDRARRGDVCFIPTVFTET